MKLLPATVSIVPAFSLISNSLGVESSTNPAGAVISLK